MSKYITIISRAEPIDIIDTALGVPAKIDTGAFRSSIHVKSVTEYTKAGIKTLKFELLGHACSPIARMVEVTDFSQLAIRNSTGSLDERYEVVLKIRLGNKIFSTSFTLSDRSSNVFPILIGRKALKNRFLVDVAQANIRRSDLLAMKGLSPETDEDFE